MSHEPKSDVLDRLGPAQTSEDHLPYQKRGIYYEGIELPPADDLGSQLLPNKICHSFYRTGGCYCNEGECRHKHVAGFDRKKFLRCVFLQPPVALSWDSQSLFEEAKKRGSVAAFDPVPKTGWGSYFVATYETEEGAWECLRKPLFVRSLPVKAQPALDREFLPSCLDWLAWFDINTHGLYNILVVEDNPSEQWINHKDRSSIAASRLSSRRPSILSLPFQTQLNPKDSADVIPDRSLLTKAEALRLAFDIDARNLKPLILPSRETTASPSSSTTSDPDRNAVLEFGTSPSALSAGSSNMASPE
ncbi:hypothetical protein HK097_001950, partial [Rhizophlyctis rosea]